MKQSIQRDLRYLVQARITITEDKHVCQSCGDDAYFRTDGYEPVTPEDDVFFGHDETEFQSYEEVVAHVAKNPANQRLFEATVEEQRQRGPQRHTTDYHCEPCLLIMLGATMGSSLSAATMLKTLKETRKESAVWLIRDLKRRRSGLMGMPSRRLDAALAALRNVDAIPQIGIDKAEDDDDD